MNDQNKNKLPTAGAPFPLMTEVQSLREALTMFVHLAESRLRELGSLSPEMAKCLNRGRDALAISTGQEI